MARDAADLGADVILLVEADPSLGGQLTLVGPTGAVTRNGADLPGVMTPAGVRRLIELWAVQPGPRALLVCDERANEASQVLARDLGAVSVDVVGVSALGRFCRGDRFEQLISALMPFKPTTKPSAASCRQARIANPAAHAYA